MKAKNEIRAQSVRVPVSQVELELIRRAAEAQRRTVCQFLRVCALDVAETMQAPLACQEVPHD